MNRLLLSVFAGLALLSATAVAHADAWDDNNCGDRLVLCVTTKGVLGRPRHATRFFAGENVHVLVLGVLPDDTTMTIDVAAQSRGDSELPPGSSGGTAPTTPQPAVLPPPMEPAVKAEVDNLIKTTKQDIDNTAKVHASAATKEAASFVESHLDSVASRTPLPAVSIVDLNTKDEVARFVKLSKDGIRSTVTDQSPEASKEAATILENRLDSLVAEPAPVLPAGAKVVANRVVTIPSADYLEVDLTQTSKGVASRAGNITLQIEDALYFARPALAFLWVSHGSRTITAEHTVIENSASFTGVALQVWPWGHRQRALSAFESWGHGRTFGDLFSFEIGTDLDFTKPFDRAFLGVAIEPISGVGLSTGVAVTTGQFFSGAPASSTMAVVDRRMWQPYFSLTLSTELFNTLKTLASQNSDIKP